MMESGPQHSGIGVPPSNNERAERLIYLADMLGELQDMAAREGCVTLAGLLALSHVEAQQQAKADAAGAKNIT